MRVICSYCRKEMDEKEPLDDDRVSHGFCSECSEYFEEQKEGLSLEGYLDKFEAPIMIVDADCRILAANEMAERITGKPRREVFGLLSGEAMECIYARLPEGCGRTVHCETCTIRKTIMKAMDSGEPQLHAPVVLRKGGREIKMIISTEKIDELVRIVIENVNEAPNISMGMD